MTFVPEQDLFFAQNIKALRQLKGLTQTEFGQPFGLSRGVVNNYERGMVPPFGVVLSICQYFNLDVVAFGTKPGIAQAKLPEKDTQNKLEVAGQAFDALPPAQQRQQYLDLLAQQLELKALVQQLSKVMH